MDWGGGGGIWGACAGSEIRSSIVLKFTIGAVVLSWKSEKSQKGWRRDMWRTKGSQVERTVNCTQNLIQSR